MKDLAVRLIEHQWWLERRTDGVRANFSYENHTGIYLSGKDLTGMSFYRTLLVKANLSGCNLGTADSP